MRNVTKEGSSTLRDVDLMWSRGPPPLNGKLTYVSGFTRRELVHFNRPCD